ncbi:hypothetical protein NQ315_000083 [Exocentrus adspersus]|uniref:CUB domain-containing protein n=1 Tax=Exocentrus adspersus TaxID=1586481 RepID=A0AAV8VUM6_9CUCU|nr:hypothetical protein NQ315_000083 [Exocentrus adspersus]
MHWRLALSFFVTIYFIASVYSQFNDICGLNNGKRFFLENGQGGSVVANYKDNLWNNRGKNNSDTSKCTVELVTCPSCIIDIKFRYLNISRNCGRVSIFDNCGCDYVWIYEPPTDNRSGEQFCGRFIQNNISQLSYVSQTRSVAVTFIYNTEYGQAFTVDYTTRRNRVHFTGYPKTGNMNNASQYISSPFFPYLYPVDLSVEYVINCESLSPCRISLIFTDFLIADSSIIEFFDWNEQRMYVTFGNQFRPPILISTGPSLVIRFYANGASNFGFRASYSYILGNINDLTLAPNVGCGGFVNNLGGAITMMNMVEQGVKFFDCVWIIKPPEIVLHRKTHLYVKVVNFTKFAGSTDLVIKQGITSNEAEVEVLRYPIGHFRTSKQVEHVVPISKGFYVRLKGCFGPESQLAIVFAAFNYKDCLATSDFLCHNLRCISILLSCDGFDHCGDNSDEPTDCSLDPKDHREFSKIPNFLFPKMEPYSDIATATFVFLTCSFGLIGVILAMALLLYRINIRAQQQRQIQDHLETIHAILEEGIGDVEEETIVPDEPPDYEAPPDYEEIIKKMCVKKTGIIKVHKKSLPQNQLVKNMNSLQDKVQLNLTNASSVVSLASSSKSYDSARIPNSPPPAYENIQNHNFERKIVNSIDRTLDLDNSAYQLPDATTSSYVCYELDGTKRLTKSIKQTECKADSTEEGITKYLDIMPTYSSHIFSEIRKSFRYCKSVNFMKQARKIISFSEDNLVRHFSDSELITQSTGNISRCVDRAKKTIFKKSFSTDDITLL